MKRLLAPVAMMLALVAIDANDEQFFETAKVSLLDQRTGLLGSSRRLQ